ncbi:MAG: hypothetical protein BM549_08965 [Lacinutrix sp. MedPE-SW]|nr:MAG: hypothetical protein BM549_08965 [Lacinutrix sp. MedPE-SW]
MITIIKKLNTMKKYIKIVALFCVTVFLFNCNEDDNYVSPDTSSGWVEFAGTATTTGQTSPLVTIPLSVNVPVYRDGLDISYTITPVEGDYTQFISGGATGTAFANPADYSRTTTIDLELMNMEEGRDFVTSFDITLTAVSGQNVSLGLDETSVLVHRVTIPCSNPESIPATYFVGDYAISDVAATIGPGNGTENFAAGTVTLSVDPTDPNKRVFTASVLPAFNAQPEIVVIEFSTDNTAKLDGFVDPGLACSAAGPYIFTASTGTNNPWDICNDQTITIQYTEDPNASCGGPFASSFSLTKI